MGKNWFLGCDDCPGGFRWPWGLTTIRAVKGLGILDIALIQAPGGSECVFLSALGELKTEHLLESFTVGLSGGAVE